MDPLKSRPWINQMSRVTNPAGVGTTATGPTFLRRPYVAPTNYTTTGIFLDAGPLNRLQFDGTGPSLSPLPFYGVGARDNGCLCQALPSQDFGISSDDQIAAGYKRENGFAHFTFSLNDNVVLYAEGVWGDSASLTVGASWWVVLLAEDFIGRMAPGGYETRNYGWCEPERQRCCC